MAEQNTWHRLLFGGRLTLSCLVDKRVSSIHLKPGTCMVVHGIHIAVGPCAMFENPIWAVQFYSIPQKSGKLVHLRLTMTLISALQCARNQFCHIVVASFGHLVAFHIYSLLMRIENNSACVFNQHMVQARNLSHA